MVAPPDNAPPDNDVLWARSLHYSHDRSPALVEISVSVRQGEILALTGPRGSGKTTLLRCLSGQLRPSRARSGSTASPCTPWARSSANGCAATGSAGSATSRSCCPS